MALSINELMVQRWKVIAEYPRSKSDGFSIGDIITDDGIDAVRNQRKKAVPLLPWDMFPHLFKKLEWWEEIDESDLKSVQYLKLFHNKKVLYIHKVENWAEKNFNGCPLYEYFNKVGYPSIACVSELEIATEQEYTDHLNSKTTQP